MGALRKAIDKLLDLAGFDSGRTKWNKHGMPETGYTVQPHEFWDGADNIMRIARGKVQLGLVLYTWRLTAGTCSRLDEPLPEWTPWVTLAALKEKMGCRTTDSILDELRNGRARGVVAFETRGRSEVRIRTLHRNWHRLKMCEKCGECHERGGACAVAGPEPVKQEPIKVDVRLKPFLFGSEFYTFKPEKPAPLLQFKSRDGAAMQGCISFNRDTGAAEIEVWQPKQKIERLTPPVRGSESVETSRPAGKTVGFSSPLAASLAGFGIISDLSRKRLLYDCEAASDGRASEDEITAAVEVIGEQTRKSGRARSVSGVILAEVPRYFSSEAYRAGVKPGQNVKSTKDQDEIVRLQEIVRRPPGNMTAEMIRRARERLNELLA